MVAGALKRAITCTVEEGCPKPRMLAQPPALGSGLGESGHWALFSTSDHETTHLLHNLVVSEQAEQSECNRLAGQNQWWRQPTMGTIISNVGCGILKHCSQRFSV
ncbi:uncharacterized [Tachysurus ichikawai]